MLLFPSVATHGPHETFILLRNNWPPSRVVHNDMTRTIIAALFAAILLGAAPQAFHYETSLTPLYGSSIPYSGVLDLSISDGGIVSGYYHPSYNIAYIPVTGGRDGNRIWLNIGFQDRISVLGTIEGNRITGTATMAPDSSPYNFSATLAANTY